jgi:hypothetical protein
MVRWITSVLAQNVTVIPARGVLGPRRPDTLITRHQLATFTELAEDPAEARRAAPRLSRERVVSPGPSDFPSKAAAFR